MWPLFQGEAAAELGLGDGLGEEDFVGDVFEVHVVVFAPDPGAQFGAP